MSKDIAFCKALKSQLVLVLLFMFVVILFKMHKCSRNTMFWDGCIYLFCVISIPHRRTISYVVFRFTDGVEPSAEDLRTNSKAKHIFEQKFYFFISWFVYLFIYFMYFFLFDIISFFNVMNQFDFLCR